MTLVLAHKCNFKDSGQTEFYILYADSGIKRKLRTRAFQNHLPTCPRYLQNLDKILFFIEKMVLFPETNVN